MMYGTPLVAINTGENMKWHTVALRLALALVPALVVALLDGRVTAQERESLLGELLAALERVNKP